ncbi:MAG: hypothetical protein WD035_04290 [Balneolaceae bacterium]
MALFMIPVAGLTQDRSLAELIRQARAAGIEQAQLDHLQDRAATRGISDEELISIIEPSVALAEKNLPSDLIFQKALEGMSKGVSAQQMIPVLQNIQQSTESVVPVIDSWMERGEVDEMLTRSGERFDREMLRNEMLKVSAKAVSQQVGLNLVQDILNTLTEQGVIPTTKPSSVIAGIGITPDLPEVAERPEAVRGIVVRAIQSGFSAAEIQNLPGAMNVAQRRSQMPASAVLEGVSQQLQRELPASQILQNLFNGNVGGGPPGRTPPGLDNRPGQEGPPDGVGPPDGTGLPDNSGGG